MAQTTAVLDPERQISKQSEPQISHILFRGRDKDFIRQVKNIRAQHKILPKAVGCVVVRKILER
jgi:hypothetical protein